MQNNHSPFNIGLRARVYLAVSTLVTLQLLPMGILMLVPLLSTLAVIALVALVLRSVVNYLMQRREYW